MFSGGLESSVKKYQIISCAKEQFPGISLSVVDEETPRATASQAADELINASDIKAAFVVYGEKGGSVVSARSYGQVNVQVVLEKLGGGGNAAVAGAQVPGKSLEQVTAELVESIDQYVAG